MDITKIKILLEKYDEGRTSLREEQELHDYFRDGTAVPELLPYWRHFTLVSMGRDHNPGLNVDLENKLSDMIDSREKMPLPKNRTGFFLRMAAAAALAILIGVSGLLVMRDKWNKNQDTFTDPRQAYAEAQKTLLYVSNTLNRGIEPLSPVAKINAGNKSLKSLDKMNHSLDMINLVSFINNSSNLKK